MFIEPHFHSKNIGERGWIEVICGPMFSGKTEELIRRLRRVEIAGMSFVIFKPEIDARYSRDLVQSHNQNSIESIPIDNPSQIRELSRNHSTIGLDEAQFFDKSIVPVAIDLANEGKRVIISGLDMDYTGRPFGPMSEILSSAEFVTKLHAICRRCGSTASFSYRLSKSTAQIELGEMDKYEPRCRQCFYEVK